MKTVLRLVLVLTLTSLVAAAALAEVYTYAQPKIQRHKEAALKRAIFQVLPGTQTYADTVMHGKTVYACAGPDGARIGYAIPAEGNGYQGTISLMFGVTPDMRKVTGMSVLGHAETPGLGAKIEEASFTGKFADLNVLNGIELVKNAPPDKATGKVDAITGATISSRAAVRIINAALAQVGGN